MNTLITGGAGFIGPHLATRLLNEGHSVVSVDDLSLGRSENVPAHRALKFVALDVCREEFARLLLAVRPDRVYHLAAR